jgi:hypothetical protein
MSYRSKCIKIMKFIMVLFPNWKFKLEGRNIEIIWQTNLLRDVIYPVKSFKNWKECYKWFKKLLEALT